MTAGKATGAGAGDREPAGAAPDAGGASSTQRIDKWLWFVRLVKTRSLAAGLAAEGRVRINGRRIDKPSATVRIGDVVTVVVHHRVKVLKVLQTGERRGSATEASLLAEDLSPAIPEHGPRGDAGKSQPAGRKAGAGRPTKRERRAIDRLRGG